MSRKRKRPSYRRRGVEPVGIQVMDHGPDTLEAFFRFGGSSMCPCGCSTQDAVQIGSDGWGRAAYPAGAGLDRAGGEEFCQAIGDEPLLWWYDCPHNENVVVRSPVKAG